MPGTMQIAPLALCMLRVVIPAMLHLSCSRVFATIAPKF
jgi:hypothetical protein